MRGRLGIAILVSLIITPLLFSGNARLEDSFSPYVDSKGAISRPTDYRAKWSHMGSWVVPDEKAPGYGFHDVYTQPETIEAFRKSGQFPDGAVLVKEIRKVQSAGMSTGEARWAGDIAAWFVMIKDAKNRFPDNRNWGDGWGWALYKAADPDSNVSADFEKDCIGCHLPAEKTDWVYVQGYPTLK